ncbi:MAG: single-stranded-DNA-specific exonuclease RecJ [Deltaproteobacteria bacterium]|nr:MAG: single-stranded-DNA-specific exonuclease RecJ [Deltaproteobacteria bacterium]
MKKQWRILQPDFQRVEKISKGLKCTPTFAEILVNREIKSVKQALDFLQPSLKNIRPPFSLKDMDAAVQRIGKAIAKGEKILIFGDYDVDGITSAIVIFEFLDTIGADTSVYLPHRLKEGYGLQMQHISDIAIPNKVDLIITADCGSSSQDAVQKAQDADIDVIITDHHRVSNSLPAAEAFINPNRPDCDTGFEQLAGVGVAFMLTVSLRKYLRDINFWETGTEPNLLRLCDLVALGTIGDAAPLVAENRILTHAGINLIQTGKSRPGLKTLIEASRINEAAVTTENIAFRIVPRLNAAGRLGHAKAALDLLTAKDPAVADEIAQYLDELNNVRKETETEILTEIRQYLAKNPQEAGKSAIVLAHDNWHEGVLGIVASRLVDHYYRPVVVVSIREDLGKGSARSIPGFDIYEGLSRCSCFLEAFGGHSMAAGLKIKKENIEKFKEIFEALVKNSFGPETIAPELLIDCELQFNDISEQLLDEIEKLRPFGAANPNPVFMARNIAVKSSQVVGENHRRMFLYQPSSGTRKHFSAIHFNSVADAPLPESFDKIAFQLNWNYWNDQKYPQLVIVDAQFRPVA